MLSDDLAAQTSRYDKAGPGERMAIVTEMANKQAQAAYNISRAGTSWQPQKPRQIDALRKAVLFLMVKDEADIIGQNLDHHFTLGFRRFFILDNASSDGTAEVINDFRIRNTSAEVFYAFDFVVGHYQGLKMKALDAFMQLYLGYEDVRPEWLFFVDADEFITCAAADEDTAIRRFNDILNDTDKDLLVFHWVQCASKTVITTLPSGNDLFEAFPLTWPAMTVAVPKIAYRLGKNLTTVQGNHAVEEYPGELSSVVIMATEGFHLFHFPTRTVDQLRKKVVNANKALTATVDRDGLSGTAGHWREYYKWYVAHGNVALEQIINDHIQGCVGR